MVEQKDQKQASKKPPTPQRLKNANIYVRPLRKHSMYIQLFHFHMSSKLWQFSLCGIICWGVFNCLSSFQLCPYRNLHYFIPYELLSKSEVNKALFTGFEKNCEATWKYKKWLETTALLWNNIIPSLKYTAVLFICGNYLEKRNATICVAVYICIH